MRAHVVSWLKEAQKSLWSLGAPSDRSLSGEEPDLRTFSPVRNSGIGSIIPKLSHSAVTQNTLSINCGDFAFQENDMLGN